MKEQYTFKVAPDYTNAYGGRGDHYICLEEWDGRTVEDFAAGMAKRSGVWDYTVNRYTLAGRGEFAEHTWTRRK